MAVVVIVSVLLVGLATSGGLQNPDGCDSGAVFKVKDLDVKTFTDAKDGPNLRYYRYLLVDSLSQTLFVGAMNKIYGLNLGDISNKEGVRQKDLSPDPKDIDMCKIQGKKVTPDCQNHIRFIARNMSNSDVLAVCGTGAYNPKSYQLNIQYPRISILSLTSGIGKCPYDPFDNSTAILVENNNPGDLPALYSGTVSDFIKADPLIFRPALHRSDGSKAVDYVRTLRRNPKWLNEPQFVGSFDVGDQVYFFFREVALEYTNCGKKIYSRVAKVCKNDNGGRAVLNKVWTSYLKARLNCSIPGEYPYYFDEIQDVASFDGETFYGLFTTNINGLTASAICAFSRYQIDRAFNGPFKDQVDSRSNWLPVPDDDVPKPRPGNCTIRNTRGLPDTILNFIRSRPLMDYTVAHQYGRPVFYKSNCLMQKLAVAVNESGNGELVFYTASNAGVIYKIFAWPSTSIQKAPHSVLATTFRPFQDGRPIWSMQLHNNHLYLGTDSSVTQLNIVVCQQYAKVDHCLFDPYCGWDRFSELCRSIKFSKGLITYKNIDQSKPIEKAIMIALGQPLFSLKNISRYSGTSLTLPVDYKLHIEGTVTWTKNNNVMNSGKPILAHDNSLIIPDLDSSDQGVYRAVDSKDNPVAEYRVSVDTTKDDIEKRWIKKFDAWCQEFEKYQNSIRQWEQKCGACCDNPSNAISQFGGK
ncbi:semaphorin-2A-like [Gigantopelta aegis]|uniref:semaphorin-2A-like n=1 Tax=Gigantopelta aegis TaxID=1735272 RepID=UPI001B88E589|nr:semaphorin-2A-like [Gigantopelta aegis]XP_041372495.1 semaphorin-2A-like [Gigantopelta aegis]XP_041372504.1 semaphorin-2A-like [Gigantopelta aegis]